MGIIAIDLSQGREGQVHDEILEKRGQRPNDEPQNCASAAVIALDPGQTTGWSFMLVHPESLSDPKVRVLDNITTHQHGQVKSVRDDLSMTDGESLAVDDLWDFIDAWPGAAIVMEDFVIRGHDRSRQFLSPVRIMAKIDYLLWKTGRSAFRQSPSDAKNTCSDARLKEWGLYDSYGGLNHARDADRHALLFLRKSKQNEYLRRAAWPHIFDNEHKLQAVGG